MALPEKEESKANKENKESRAPMVGMEPTVLTVLREETVLME